MITDEQNAQYHRHLRDAATDQGYSDDVAPEHPCPVCRTTVAAGIPVTMAGTAWDRCRPCLADDAVSLAEDQARRSSYRRRVMDAIGRSRQHQARTDRTWRRY